MTIKQWNNIEAITNREQQWDITVSKGEPKTGNGKNTRPGEDLKDKYRIEIGNSDLRRRLFKIYQQRNKFVEEKTLDTVFTNKKTGRSKNIQKTFLYVKELNIIAGNESVEKTFKTDMLNKDRQQQTLWKCDRQTVYQEKFWYEDTYKGKRPAWKKCDRPCAADQENIFSDCPEGCKPSGDLYFFLWELLDEGYHLCKLNTASITDVLDFPSQLFNIEQEFGSIKNLSGMAIGDYRNYIPLILTRYEVAIARPITETKYLDGKRVAVRTGQKSKDTTWKLAIKVNPQWKQAYYATKKMEQLQLTGNLASPQLVGQIYDQKEFIPGAHLKLAPGSNVQNPHSPEAIESGGEVDRDRESENPNIITAVVVDEWSPSNEDKRQFSALLKQYQWSHQGFSNLTEARYGFRDLKACANLSLNQWQELLRAIASPEAKTMFDS